jgi:glyoxylase-like metal-dependent hydrolase (beta-lactamase superfamily II)
MARTNPTTTTLATVAPDVWTAESEIRFPLGFRLPLRMTALRLQDGGLLVYSPIRLDDATATALGALGPVRHVIAPNLLHHLWARPFLERFPQARLWAPPGLASKRPDLPIAGELDGATPSPFGPEVTAIRLEGAPKLNELVLHHAPSRSLLCADLLFNVRRPPTLVTSAVLTLMGTRGKLALSRAWRSLAKDRAALAASARRVLALDFTRVLPGHGDVAEDAHDAAEAALGWMLAGTGDGAGGVRPPGETRLPAPPA